MGSRPSKVTPQRSRSGLSFVSTSSVASLNTLDSNYDAMTQGVENIRFDDVTIKSFRVGWDPPRNFKANSYQVRIFPPDKIKSRTLLRAHKEQHHTFTRLQSSTEYTVAVIGLGTDGSKSPCETATVFTLPRPPRDLEFLSTSGSDSIEISWKHCKGKQGQYDVEVIEEGQSAPIDQAHDLTDTNATFKRLVPGTQYNVNVRNVAKGMKSEEISGSWMTAPRHVCDITFSDVTQHEMTSKWKKPEGRVDSYTLHLTEKVKKPKKPMVIERLRKMVYTFNGLTPGRVYVCKIVSNAGGKTSKAQYFTQCTVPQEVAVIVARDIGPEQARVTWTPGMGDADDYDLFLTPREGVIGETTPHGIEKTEYKFAGLVPGTVYTVGIVTNAKDKSSKRVVSSFATVPGMVGDLEVSTSERSCSTQKIFWPPAAGRVDFYVISIRRDDKSEESKTIQDVFQPHYLLTDLTPGTLYRVHVAAMRDGRESSSVTKTFGTVPSAVPSLYFTKDECSWDSVRLTWESAVGGVDKYHIVCTSGVGAPLEVDVSPDEASYHFTNLQPSTLYDVSITAVSNNLESSCTKGKQITGPGEIVNFHASPTNKREIQVSFYPPDKGADNYIIKLSPLEEGSMEFDLEQSISACEHTFSNLLPGSQYNVTVIPVSSMIRGKPSSTQVYTKPGDVINVHISEDTVTTDSITIQWWGVEGNSKNVHVILTRLKKNNDEEHEVNPSIVKEEHVLSKDGAASEVVFIGLESNTVYGIRLLAEGKGGVGNDVVFTQSTLALIPDVPEDKIQETYQEENNVYPEVKETELLQKQSDTEIPIQIEKSDENPSENQENATDQEVSATNRENTDAAQEMEVPTTDRAVSLETETPTDPDEKSETSVQPSETPVTMHEIEMDKNKPDATTVNDDCGDDKIDRDVTPPSSINQSTTATESEETSAPIQHPPHENMEIEEIPRGSQEAEKEEQSEVVSEKLEDDKSESNAQVEVVANLDTVSSEAENTQNNDETIVAENTNISNEVNQENRPVSPKPETPSLPDKDENENGNDEKAQQINSSVDDSTTPPPTEVDDETTATPLPEPGHGGTEVVQEVTIEEKPASPIRDIKPVLVFPAKENNAIGNEQVPSGDLSSPTLKHQAKLAPEDPSSNTSTPIMRKKETNSLALLAVLTSTD